MSKVKGNFLDGEYHTNPDNNTAYSIIPQVGGSCSDCGSPNYLPSSNSLSGQPTIYSVTVGADDIQFADWVQECYAGATACNTSSNTTDVDDEIDQAKSHLEEVLDVVNGQNSSATFTPLVLVTGYYDPIPSPTSGASCYDVSADASVGITSDENNWLQDGLSNLNTAISQAVTHAQTTDTNLEVRFVDLSTTYSGHEFCSSDPWAYGPSIRYSLSSNPAPFHPTPEGQRAIATAIESGITAARNGGWVG